MTTLTSIKVTYLRGPTAIMQIGGLRLMTDPTLDPAGSVYQRGNLTVEKTKGPATLDIGNIDVVQLSHDQHFDNLDVGGRALLRRVARTYTTPQGAARLQGTSQGLSSWQSDAMVTPMEAGSPLWGRRPGRKRKNPGGSNRFSAIGQRSRGA